MLKFPEFRKRSHVVSKHVAVMGELSRLVEVCSLMDVSELEQELACGDDMQQHWRDVMAKLNSPAIKGPDKLRLGLLYALRYEKSANLHMLLSHETDLCNLPRTHGGRSGGRYMNQPHCCGLWP